MQYRTMENGRNVTVSKEVAFDKACDVLVCGLGTAGAVSAVCCAKKGLSVIGIDRTSMLGGLGTAGVLDYYFGTPGGAVWEYNEKCYKLIQDGKYLTSGGRDIRPEALPGFLKSNVLMKEAKDFGCELLLECRVTGIYTDGNKVVGAECFDGEKFISVSCRVLIDGADGSCCRLCGCEFLPVRPDGHTMQFSHMLTTFDKNYVRGGCRFNGFPESENTREWSYKILTSTLSYEKYDFGIASESALLGLRENPNVRTEYCYTLSSVVDGMKCEKPLFYGFAPVDNCTRDKQNESDLIQDWFLIARMERYGMSAPMPMGALIPKDFCGLLVVGKATGLGHELSALLRMKSDMEKCGEAAAYIAYFACMNKCDVRDVPYCEVLSLLKKSGAYSEAHNIGIADLNEPLPETKLWRSYIPPKNTDELRLALSSDEPGPAIWYMRNHINEEYRMVLYSFLSSDDRTLCENSAICLGICGDKRCIPVLLDILSNAPVGRVFRVSSGNTPYAWLNKTCFCNYLKSIVLLGRFGRAAEGCIPLLERIVETKGTEAARAMTADEGYTGIENMASEFARFAKSSLLRIKNEL